MPSSCDQRSNTVLYVRSPIFVHLSTCPETSNSRLFVVMLLLNEERESPEKYGKSCVLDMQTSLRTLLKEQNKYSIIWLVLKSNSWHNLIAISWYPFLMISKNVTRRNTLRRFHGSPSTC